LAGQYYGVAGGLISQSQVLAVCFYRAVVTLVLKGHGSWSDALVAVLPALLAFYCGCIGLAAGRYCSFCIWVNHLVGTVGGCVGIQQRERVMGDCDCFVGRHGGCVGSASGWLIDRLLLVANKGLPVAREVVLD
jgi:hypothetical protein